jgi:hypothetical protein
MHALMAHLPLLAIFLAKHTLCAQQGKWLIRQVLPFGMQCARHVRLARSSRLHRAALHALHAPNVLLVRMSLRNAHQPPIVCAHPAQLVHSRMSPMQRSASRVRKRAQASLAQIFVHFSPMDNAH